MLYRPGNPNSLLWDTWIFHHDHTYHLYHLIRDDGKAWDRIGHATSTDLIHWEPHDDIPVQATTGWDSGPTLTGMVIPYNGGFAMTYGSVVNGVERIGLMTSDDLFHWTKHPQNPVLLPRAPFYEEDPSELALPAVAWRDAFVEWNEADQVFEAIVCARVPEGDLMRRGCIARARSKDLLDWELLPPVAAPMLWQDMEVPERFEIGEYAYLVFSTAHSKGPDLETASRKRCSGTFYMVSTDGGKNYHTPAGDPLLLGSGEGRWDCYVGRFIRHEGETLLYHHNCGPRPALALPKKIMQQADGELALHYWPNLDALLGPAMDLDGLETHPIKTGPRAHGEWSTDGQTLTGRSSYGPSAALLSSQGANLHLRAEVDMRGSDKAGILVRFDVRRGRGVGVILDGKGGRVVIGRAQRMHSGVIKVDPHDVFHTALDTGKPLDVRVVAGFEFYEVYLDDRLIFTNVMADQPMEGRCGFMVDSGEATFRNVGIWNWQVASFDGLQREEERGA